MNRDPIPFPEHELEHTGCPHSCLLLTGATSTALGALYFWFPHETWPWLRHVLDEGLPAYPALLFGLVLLAHFGALGKMPFGRRDVARLAEAVGCRLQQLPSGRYRIHGEFGARPFELVLAAQSPVIGIDRAHIRVLQVDSPVRVTVTGLPDSADSGFFPSHYLVEHFECWELPAQELRARAPRLERAVESVIRRSVRRIEVRDGRLEAELDANIISPALLRGILRGLDEVADALTALAAAPQLLDLSVNVARSPTTCPYCKDDLQHGQTEPCGHCGTLHHRECLVELGRCSVLGCGGGRRGARERTR